MCCIHTLCMTFIIYAAFLNRDVDSSWVLASASRSGADGSSRLTLGQIKIETLNYSERLLQAVWIPKRFAFLTHYFSSQAVLIDVFGAFSDCIWSHVWHITCAQKLHSFVHIFISHILSLTEMTAELSLIYISHSSPCIHAVCCILI